MRAKPRKLCERPIETLCDRRGPVLERGRVGGIEIYAFVGKFSAMHKFRPQSDHEHIRNMTRGDEIDDRGVVFIAFLGPEATDLFEVEVEERSARASAHQQSAMTRLARGNIDRRGHCGSMGVAPDKETGLGIRRPHRTKSAGANVRKGRTSSFRVDETRLAGEAPDIIAGAVDHLRRPRKASGQPLLYGD